MCDIYYGRRAHPWAVDIEEWNVDAKQKIKDYEEAQRRSEMKAWYDDDHVQTVEGFYYRDSLRNVEMSQMGLIEEGNNGPMDSVVMISFFLQSKFKAMRNENPPGFEW